MVRQQELSPPDGTGHRFVPYCPLGRAFLAGTIDEDSRMFSGKKDLFYQFMSQDGHHLKASSDEANHTSISPAPR